MNYATAMGCSQSERNVMSDDNGSINCKDAARTQVAAQVCAFHQFHDDEIVSVGLAIVVDLHYVGML